LLVESQTLRIVVTDFYNWYSRWNVPKQ